MVALVIVSALAFVLAFVASMPIAGPIAVLVVSRAAEGRFTESRKIVLGAALAEGTYAGLAFATFATFFGKYPAAIPISRSLTTVVLLVVGLAILRWKPKPPNSAPEPERSGRTAFGLGFFTSGFNPTIFITWCATATAIYTRQIVEMKTILAVPFGISAALGIVSWYAVLLRLMTRYQSRLPQRFLMWFIRGTGALLIVIAAWTGIGVVRSLLH